MKRLTLICVLCLISTKAFSEDAPSPKEVAGPPAPAIEVKQEPPPVVATPAPQVIAPIVAPTPVVTVPEEPKRQKHFAIGGVVTGAQTAKFTKAYYSSTVGTTTTQGPLTIQYDLNPTEGILLEYRNMPENAFGFQLGGEYDFPATVKQVTLTGSGGTMSAPVVSDVRLSELYAYANAAYRWTWFYLPFGLNISMPKLDGAPVGETYYGGVGVQLGMGFQITDDIGVEFLGYATTINMYYSSTTSNSTTSLDFKDGVVSGAKLAIKILF